MALIQCPECNNQVSDSAKTCPHCGYVLKQNNTITCPECGKQVSDKVKTCTNCGYELMQNNSFAADDRELGKNQINANKSNYLANPFKVFGMSNGAAVFKSIKFYIYSVIILAILVYFFITKGILWTALIMLIPSIILLSRTVFDAMFAIEIPQKERQVYTLLPFDDLLFFVLAFAFAQWGYLTVAMIAISTALSIAAILKMATYKNSLDNREDHNDDIPPFKNHNKDCLKSRILVSVFFFMGVMVCGIILQNKTNTKNNIVGDDATQQQDLLTTDVQNPNFIPEKTLKIPYATSNDGFVNIRSIPSNDGIILGKITSFGSGVILGTEIDYYKVNDGEVTGYCYSKYIDYYTWYDGTGNKRLVATKDCPLYSGYSEGNAKPLGIIPAGTIIGDKFYNDNSNDYQAIIEKGDCYILNTPFDNEWKVKKSYVTIEKCSPTVVKNSNIGYQNSTTSNSQEQGVTTGYVDLGLPSGTKWKSANEKGYYSYDDAVNKFGKNLPTRAQCEEIQNKCRCVWSNNGMKVTGPNGNSIFLPAEGTKCGGPWESAPQYVGTSGCYWSSTCTDDMQAWTMAFMSSGLTVLNGYRSNRLSVRLVKN